MSDDGTLNQSGPQPSEGQSANVGPDAPYSVAVPEQQEVITMPFYRSHKVVQAAKIRDVFMDADREGVTDEGGALLRFNECPDVHVDAKYLEKHKPEKGGYYVAYGDGYESFSPALAFESGYTLVQ